MAAAALLVLFAVEGVTVPPVLLKIGSTDYRFVRYFPGSSAYRRKGRPTLVLRVFRSLVVVTTFTVLVSGIALMFVSASARQSLLLLHKPSFVV